jgi:hypothetical protein
MIFAKRGMLIVTSASWVRWQMALASGRSESRACVIEEAIHRSNRNDERWCIAELPRLKGALVLLEGSLASDLAAGSYFLTSIDWARRQGALT